LISLAVHRNLLHLVGFCDASSKRLFVYSYMPSGRVVVMGMFQVTT
jgi:hypothetical protein